MISERPIIGKNVIEALTLGMYEDSKFIFREYVQNSADQIDKAVENGILENSEDGYIEITISETEKRIIIEDNATGIKSSNVLPLLGNIAQSIKDRTKDKGFRGIGRLGGLGYCNKLTFETSYKDESQKSIMVWDAKQLRIMIHNQDLKIEAAEVISSITNLCFEVEESSKHYFRVILEDVTNNDLLNVEDIRNYLSMVAPVPFHPRFLLSNKIYDALKQNGLKLDEYRIFVNNEEIFKAYTTKVYDKNGKSIDDDIFDIDTFTLKTLKGELMVWGWYGVNTFKGVIPENNLSRGFRLRKNNIQIGSDMTLLKLHKRERDNYYFLGEVHAFHPQLIPNARRDYFVENEYYFEFEKKLKHLFKELNKNLVYKASNIRSLNKAIGNYKSAKEKFEEKLKKEFYNNDERIRLEQDLKNKKSKAIESEKKLKNINDKTDNESHISKIYKRIVKNQGDDISEESTLKVGESKPVFITDKLTKLSKSERKIISKIFSIIDGYLTPDIAELIKQRITEEFK